MPSVSRLLEPQSSAQPVLGLGLTVLLIAAMTSMTTMFSGWWKKKNRSPSPDKTPSPNKYRSKSRSKASKLSSESSLASTDQFSEAPSGFSQRETKRSNPLYRNSIGDDPRNSDNGMSDDEEVIEGFGRHNSVKSSISTYSGFGIDAEAETTNFAAKTGLTPSDKAAGYIGVVECENAEKEKSPPPLVRKLSKDDITSSKAQDNSKSPQKGKSKKKKSEKSENLEKSKDIQKNEETSIEKLDGGDSPSKSDSDTGKPKPARDLDAAKEKRDADKAARLAKIRAAREQKKEKENKLLEEALAMIDNLPDE